MTTEAQQEFDWNFRPDRYWETSEAVHANIKGTFRRRWIEDAGAAGVLEGMPASVFADDVTQSDRISMGVAIPGADSGEYLPDYKQQEVEIVRFTINSTLTDVIAIRARPLKGRITWRIVQDNPFGRMRLTRLATKQPMTFRELTDMLDTIKCDWGPDWITESWIDAFIEGRELDDMSNWIMIESCFYPEIEAWFANRLRNWVDAKKEELLADEDVGCA